MSDVFDYFFRKINKKSISAKIRNLASQFRDQFVCLCSKSEFLSSVYFAFFSKKFYREHRAVLAGQVEYRNSMISDKLSFGGFRRNIHRLEKAFTMQPRKEVFAESYIDETVDQFLRSVDVDSKIEIGEKKWAYDVLSEYFSIVRATPVVERARLKFEGAAFKPTSGDKYIPYSQNTVRSSGVSFSQLRSLFVERRSVRWFDGRPVARELIEAAVEAARFAPSACNRLPYKFHVFLQPKGAGEIAKLAGGTAGFANNIPCLIVVVGDMSNYTEERDRHLVYIDSSLASMQLMLALQCQGLSTVPINWPDVEERELKMSRALGLAPYERTIMLIGVGYGRPDGLIPYSQKKPVSSLLKVERDLI